MEDRHPDGRLRGGLIYVVFDQLLAIPWPPTLAGMLFPVLHAIPSV